MRQSNQRPGVLVVGNFLNDSLGTCGVCEELAVQLDRAGWRVSTTSRRPRRLSRLVDMVATTWRLRHTYDVAQVDVFSGPAFLWAEAVCATLRAAGKPYVLTLHGGALPDFARRWTRRVARLLDSANAVTVPSRYLREQLVEYCDRLLMIPNAVQLDRYPFRHRVASRPTLVWLRSFHEIYNPTLAPRVVALLQEQFPDVRLLMGGPDKGDGSLTRTRAVAAALGVLDRIEFHGTIPKAAVPSWLSQGDVFLNTTNVDNTPVSVVEALACGLCVVSTNVGGLPYLLDDDRTAILVPPKSERDMASAVTRVLCEPGLASRLSSGGREATQASSWPQVIKQWDRLLRQTASRGSFDGRAITLSEMDA
jgi:glycosyltransferase involved in cell wall biosynthesis